MYILSFFTSYGIPKTGLSATVRIIEIPSGDVIVNNAPMFELENGFYYYDFINHDLTKDYAVLCDGSNVLNSSDRYVYGSADDFLVEIRNAILDEPLSSHQTPGTIGQAISSLHNNIIFINTINGQSGTSFPIGSEKYPVDNINDAMTLAQADGIKTLHINGTVIIPSGIDLSNFTLKSDKNYGNNLVIESGVITNKTYIQNLTVSGIMNGNIQYLNCVLGYIQNFAGEAKDCLIIGDIDIVGTEQNRLIDCDTFITVNGAYKKVIVHDKILNMIRCHGRYQISQKTGDNYTAVGLTAGEIFIDELCTTGNIQVDGIGVCIDENDGTLVDSSHLVSPEKIADFVWDENIFEHEIDESMGKVLYNSSIGVENINPSNHLITDITTKLEEVWGRLGLDPDKPLTTGTSQITFGEVVMMLAEVGQNVVLTRLW